MKKMRFIIFLILILILIPVIKNYSFPNAANRNQQKEKDEIIELFEIPEKTKKYGHGFSQWLKGNLNRNLVPSAVIGIANGKKLIYHTGAYAGIDTRFGIASLSKTFTTVLALLLHQEGTLSIFDPVNKYLPEVIIEKEELGSEPVKLWHLLSHTSGIPSYGNKYKTVKIKGKNFTFLDQMFPAGTCYTYSNVSFVLMKYVLEAATGRNYAEILRDEIFTPLGMNSSTGNYSNGTGGIISTLSDLSKYASMLASEGKVNNKTFLTKESLKLMLSKPVELPQSKVHSYFSMGWEVISVNGEVDSYHKAGRWFGQASGLQVFPKKNIAYIYLSNPPRHLVESFMKWRRSLNARMWYFLRKITSDPGLSTAWPRLTPDKLRQYEGKYIDTKTGKIINISFKKDRLYSDQTGQVLLRPFSTNRFSMGPRHLLYNFVWRENRVVALAMMKGYFKKLYE